MVESKIVKDHERPIVILQLSIDMARHIVVDLSEIL